MHINHNKTFHKHINTVYIYSRTVHKRIKHNIKIMLTQLIGRLIDEMVR